MKNTAFFIALFAQIGVDFNSLSKEEQDNIREVYRDHLNVKQIRHDTNLVFEAIGVEKEIFDRIKDDILENLRGENKSDVASAIGRFTKNAESPEELFAYGFLLSHIAYNDDNKPSIPEMLAELLKR